MVLPITSKTTEEAVSSINAVHALVEKLDSAR